MSFRLLAFAVALSLASSHGRAQDAVDGSAAAGSAVVTLRGFSPSGTPMRMGSGFFLPDGRIVTSISVVQDAGRIEVLGERGHLANALYAEMLDQHSGIAILPRVVAPPATLPFAPYLPRAGDPVSVVMGPRRGGPPTASAGNVARLRAVNGRTLVQITAPIDDGAWGGPVVNADGELVGVSVVVPLDGQDLSFAIPARDILVPAQGLPGRIAFTSRDTAWTGSRQPGTPRPLSTRPMLPDGVPVKVGQSVEGRLAVFDFRRPNRSYADGYRLEGQAGERITVTLRSLAFDSWLTVTSRDGSFVQDDDNGGGGTNSRLIITLPYTGEYVILANSRLPGGTGAYVLSILRGSITTAAAEAAAQGWRRIFSANDGTIWYVVERTRIVRLGGNRYSAMVRIDHPRPMTMRSGNQYDRDIVNWEIQCTTSQSRLVAYWKYLGDQTVESAPAGSVDPTAWGDVRRGTYGETVVAAVCGAVR